MKTAVGAADDDWSEEFATLYRLYEPRIRAFAYRRSHSDAVADAVTAATFERAFRQLDRFEPRGGDFGTWLFRIASNELAAHRRPGPRSPGENRNLPWPTGEEPAQRLLEALRTLNDRYQQAITLRYLSGLSHEEAAEAMGVSKPVMAVTLSRALSALKKASDRSRRTNPMSEMTVGELRDLLDRMIVNDPSVAELPLCLSSPRSSNRGRPFDVLVDIETTSWLGAGRWVFLKFEQPALHLPGSGLSRRAPPLLQTGRASRASRPSPIVDDGTGTVQTPEHPTDPDSGPPHGGR